MGLKSMQSFASRTTSATLKEEHLNFQIIFTFFFKPYPWTRVAISSQMGQWPVLEIVAATGEHNLVVVDFQPAWNVKDLVIIIIIFCHNFSPFLTWYEFVPLLDEHTKSGRV